MKLTLFFVVLHQLTVVLASSNTSLLELLPSFLISKSHLTDAEALQRHMDDFKGVFSARNDPLKLNQLKEWMLKSKAENLIPSYDQTKNQLVTNLNEIKIAASSIQRGDMRREPEVILDQSDLSIQSTTVVKEVTVTHSFTETITRFMTNVETSTETYHDVVTHTAIETSKNTDPGKPLEAFGSTGKDILNSKNPAHQLSINPQFSYHSKEGYEEGSSYSKPKVSPLSLTRAFVSSNKLVSKAFGVNDGNVEVEDEAKAEGPDNAGGGHKVEGEGEAVDVILVADGAESGTDVTSYVSIPSEIETSTTESSNSGTYEDTYSLDYSNEDRSSLGSASSRSKNNASATTTKSSMVRFSSTTYTNSTVTITTRVPSRWRAESPASTDQGGTGRHLRKKKLSRRNHTRPEFHLFRLNNESSKNSINIASVFAAIILAFFTVLLL